MNFNSQEDRKLSLSVLHLYFLNWQYYRGKHCTCGLLRLVVVGRSYCFQIWSAECSHYFKTIINVVMGLLLGVLCIYF
jgi:hypothetical protein